jgi:hypothetical protein
LCIVTEKVDIHRKKLFVLVQFFEHAKTGKLVPEGGNYLEITA